jgi:hypothetical protein
MTANRTTLWPGLMTPAPRREGSRRDPTGSRPRRARWAIARSVDREERGRRGAAGAKVTIVAAKNAPPDQTKKAPDFTLDLVKGGWIGLKDLAGKPFVLAFFMSCPDSRSPSPMNRLRWSRTASG